MSESNNQPASKFPISKILRYSGFAILLGMLVLSIIYQVSNPPETDEERIEATVQAGVNQGLTEVAMQTGTPEPTAIQETVQARIDATLTAVVELSATPVPEDRTATEEAVDNTVGFFEALLSPIIGIFQGMWNFAGIGGLWMQVLCCIVPPALIVIGIIND